MDRQMGLESDMAKGNCVNYMLALGNLNFTVPHHCFPLAIPIKFSEKQQASHYLYVREHRVREGTQSTWPQKRTLFVLNVPPYCTEVTCWQIGFLKMFLKV
jgi:hypothetical protein